MAKSQFSFSSLDASQLENQDAGHTLIFGPSGNKIRGKRTATGCVVEYVDGEGNLEREVPLCLDWANHSPTGFEWGYEGGGPAQLALGILALFFPKEFVMQYYQLFKSEIIATLSGDEWEIPLHEIYRWVEKTQRKHCCTEIAKELLSGKEIVNIEIRTYEKKD